jgi:hypothetical protein
LKEILVDERIFPEITCWVAENFFNLGKAGKEKLYLFVRSCRISPVSFHAASCRKEPFGWPMTKTGRPGG